MHFGAPSPVMCKSWRPGMPAPIMWTRRKGPSHENKGASGRKLKPAAVRYHALAEMAAAHKATRMKRK